MALEILKSAIDGKVATHDVHHDLESFILVIIYALYMNTLAIPEHQSNEALQSEFEGVFGGGSLREIYDRRHSVADGLEVLAENVSQRLAFLLALCSVLVENQNRTPVSCIPGYSRIPEDFGSSRPEPVLITYEALFKALKLAAESEDQ
jgi:hypothetical protein